MAKIRGITDLVEQISIDEAFFDLSDQADAERIARDLQLGITQTLHLPSSIGIAANKLVAKIANDYGNSLKRDGTPPRAFTVVPAGTEATFLAPLAVTKLWGVGPKTAEKLAEMNIRTIGDLAAQDEYKMLQRFGQVGYEITRRARGIDTRPIVTEREAKSISQETTFAKDTRDKRELQQVLRKLSLKVCSRLQKDGLVARTVKIKLRWSDFTTLTRQTTLQSHTDDTQIFVNAAEKLFTENWQGRPLRLIGMGVSGLEPAKQQIGLWDQDWEKERHVEDALAEIKEKFGDGAIKRGVKKDGK